MKYHLVEIITQYYHADFFVILLALKIQPDTQPLVLFMLLLRTMFFKFRLYYTEHNNVPDRFIKASTYFNISRIIGFLGIFPLSQRQYKAG